MSARSIVASCVLTAALGSVPAAAQDTVRTRSNAEAPTARLLDVPFVPQSEALCGGAAAAMVLRYWGVTGVRAEDFAPLVDDSADGIQVGRLSRALTERGWRAAPLSSNATDLQSQLARGRPMIALIEDRPGRNHYVVLVAWTGDHVVLHDPAYGAFRVVARTTFERAWAVTRNTALLVLPSGRTSSSVDRAPTTSPLPARSDACSTSIDEAVRLARNGALGEAETLLLLADQECPGTTAAKRELAGIRFLQEQWAQAERLARDVVSHDPTDRHAWQLVASSRFLQGDEDGALRAWNHLGQPRVDLANVQGLDRTRYDVVADVLHLDPEEMLTDRNLLRARRRIEALPGIQASRVGYIPRADGRAAIDVAIVERPPIPRRWPALVATGVHAGVARELRLDVANAIGGGEVVTGAWRWWAGRPRVAIGLALPRLWQASGLWRIEGAWEQQRYHETPTAARSADAGALTTSERRHASVSFGDWASGDLRWEVSTGVDRWLGRGAHVFAGSSLEHRSFGDRLALRVEASLWDPLGATRSTFAAGRLSAAWRSGVTSAPSWNVRAGMDTVSVGTPLDLWPTADTGQVGGVLLRAHPLIDDGAVRTADLSRVLSYGTVEFQRPLATSPFATVRWAAFVDVVKRASAADGESERTLVDAGVGVRIGLPGTPQAVRLDVARGVRDGGMALSAGWQTTWASRSRK